MKDLPDFDLDRFMPYRLSVAAARTSEALAKQYKSRFGISIPEWRVLVHLAQSGNVSVRDIEKRVAMEKPKVSRAATRLEEAGYIRKKMHDTDKRLVSLSLTRKGKALMAKLLPLALAFQNELETQLGRSLAGLEKGLDRLLDD